MATLKYDVVFGSAALPLSTGTQIEITDAHENGLDGFTAVWKSPKGSVTGKVPCPSVDLTAEELEQFDVRVDSNNQPLHRNQQVKYIGPSNDNLTSGEHLIVQDVWYSDDQLECQCIQVNSKANTDGRVVVPCKQLSTI